MEKNKDVCGEPQRFNDVYIRYVGQFVFWAVLSLVGWSFYSTLQHQTKIAVIEQRLLAIEANARIGPPAP